MGISIEQNGSRRQARLDGEMTIFQAAELKQPLLSLLADGSDVEIDLAQVTEVDTSGVQLMLLLKRTALEQGKTLSFTHHSPGVVAVIDLLNLGSTLGDPLLITQKQ